MLCLVVSCSGELKPAPCAPPVASAMQNGGEGSPSRDCMFSVLVLLVVMLSGLLCISYHSLIQEGKSNGFESGCSLSVGCDWLILEHLLPVCWSSQNGEVRIAKELSNCDVV